MFKIAEKPTESESTIIFGNCCFAEMGDCIEDKERDRWVFMFRPTPRMYWKLYQIGRPIPDEHRDPIQGWIKKSFPSVLCHCVDPTPNHQVWYIRCDYWEKECDFTEKINVQLASKLESVIAERDAYKIQNQVMPIKFKKFLKYPDLMKAEIYDEIKKQKEAFNVPLFGEQKPNMP